MEPAGLSGIGAVRERRFPMTAAPRLDAVAQLKATYKSSGLPEPETTTFGGAALA